ncbi:potassium/proton antiporter [Sphingobium sp. D43FB]|uniref:potassium/proton antiporter n=1 Tax=Sphingobium sp. D43FB TaxID=2017595 RepID=UPI000BB56557|nr:potassium/proton antiporter [Sphingobium sp. D43FB]PBN41398.1 K+/H+ antiporter [Sphingobium sp. D43FB]
MTLAAPEIALLGIGVLLLLTVLAGTLSSRFGLPALIGFLGLGMLAGEDGPGGLMLDDYLFAQFIGVLCLVFILFSGGLDTIWRSVRKVAVPALVLATFGVVISAAITGAAAILLLDFSPLQGFLLGSVVASTDAAAVFAVLRTRGVDLRPDVQALIEFESGSNDPMAIFLVGATLMLIAIPSTPIIGLVPGFAIQMVLGGAIGLGIGYLLPEVLNRAHFRYGGLGFVVSIAAALVAYGLAEVSGGNGFLSAYLAGLMAGSRTFAAKRAISTFQDGMAWLAQVAMFLTLGLLATPTRLLDIIAPGIAITVVLMFIARPISVFLCLAPFKFDWRAKLLVSWVGLRGAVPIVLATFPIVAGIPGAFAIFNIVFFVVLVSSLVQGPTLGWTARRLGLNRVAGGSEG